MPKDRSLLCRKPHGAWETAGGSSTFPLPAQPRPQLWLRLHWSQSCAGAVRQSACQGAGPARHHGQHRLIRYHGNGGLIAPEEMVKGMIATTPLGRLGQPRDIADVVAFVVSKEARWLTGQNIRATGGLA